MRLFPPSRASSPSALLALLAVNLVPLAGVLWWNWSLLAVLVIYWLESGVVGLANVPKILLASGSDSEPSRFRATLNGVPIDLSGPADAGDVSNPGDDGPVVHPENVPTALFFCVHYGIFWIVHGVFVFTFPLWASGPVGGIGVGTVAVGTTGMLLSHGLSFAVNYVGREEYRRVSPGAQLFEPYGRVFVLHLTIIFGAFLVSAFGTPVLEIALLIGLKIVVDLAAHLREHARARASPS